MGGSGRERAQARRGGEQAAPAAPRAGPSGGRFRPVYLLALPVLAFLVFGNSLGGEFVWDDRPLIVEDYTVQSFAYLDEIFTNDFFSRNESDVAYGYYRPVVTLTYVIDHALWGGRPFGFHLTNVVLHSLVCVLLVLIMRRLGGGGWVALTAGMLFAVHPIHTENVAWIAGRTDVVSLLLVLAALLVHCIVSDREREGRRARALAAVGYGLFALALLAKEMAVVLVPWVFLYELLRRDGKRALLRSLPLVIISGLYAGWRFGVLDVAAPGQPEGNGPVAVVLSALPTILRYLAWMVAPFGQSAYVQNPYVTDLGDPRLLLSLLAAVVAAVLLWRRRRTHRSACLLALALLASFLPLLNVVRIAGPLDMGAVMAERFAYFPSVPFVALAAGGIGILARRVARGAPGRTWLVGGGVAVLVAGMGVATFARNRVWHDERTLYADILAKEPGAVLIWANLTNLHIRHGELAEAEETLQMVAGLDPNSYFAWSSRALLHVVRGEFEAAVALQEAIVAESSEDNAVARNNLAFLYERTGRTAEAVEILEDLVERGKGYADVYCNLGKAYQGEGRLEEARAQFRLALDSRPDSIPIGTAWASLEMTLRNPSEAQAIFEGLLRSHPDEAGLHYNLGLVLRSAGKEKEAIRSLRRALELDPSHARARLAYDRLLGEGRDDAGAREQPPVKRGVSPDRVEVP